MSAFQNLPVNDKLIRTYCSAVNGFVSTTTTATNCRKGTEQQQKKRIREVSIFFIVLIFYLSLARLSSLVVLVPLFQKAADAALSISSLPLQEIQSGRESSDV